MDDFEAISNLVNWNSWPTYTNSRQLSQLEAFARDAFSRDTFDGYVSYVLISHQVCEDYVLLLLRHAQFTIRLNLMPSGFNWPVAKYETPGVRDSDMFGNLLKRLEFSIEFDEKKKFIEACKKLNQTRNRLAHKLIEGISLEELRTLAEEYRDTTSAVVDAFNDADEQFSSFYSESLSDPRWEHFLRQKSIGADSSEMAEKWLRLQSMLKAEREK